MNKRGQEEITGFVFIIVIVAVLLLIWISIALTKPVSQGVESYEVESFLSALLQTQTECFDIYEQFNVEKMIFKCSEKDLCQNKSSCDILHTTITGILNAAWKTENRPSKGYEFNIQSNPEILPKISAGNISSNYKSYTEKLGRRNVTVSLRVYY